MVSWGITMRSVLVLVAVVLMAQSGLAAEKLATCCEKVTREEITDPILDYLVQIKSVRPCVNAVIFQTEKGLFCTHPAAPWVRAKVQAFRNSKGQTPASPSVSPSHVSLLSMITSSAPRSSSSAPRSSSSAPRSSSSAPHPSSSAAEMPVGGNVSGQID